MTVTIKLDTGAALHKLNRTVGAFGDLTPALRSIAEGMLISTRDRFTAKQAPDGSKWAPLKPVTLKRKKRTGRGAGDILIQDGNLLGNLNYTLGADYIELGSPMIYANVQQFGAQKGAFGQTAAGAPIPWGNIPARPFLGASTQDEAQARDILTRHLNGA